MGNYPLPRFSSLLIFYFHGIEIDCLVWQLLNKRNLLKSNIYDYNMIKW